ncbi:MAG: hypothetical protein WDO72_14530 [Pseudomonadota bacterium]
MYKKFATALLAATLAQSVAPAADLGDVAQEVKAESITLPKKDLGDVAVQICSSCPTREFGTTAETTYEIGGIPVRLEDMRRELALRPRALLLLQLTPDRKHVARINIPAATS